MLSSCPLAYPPLDDDYLVIDDERRARRGRVSIWDDIDDERRAEEDADPLRLTKNCSHIWPEM